MAWTQKKIDETYLLARQLSATDSVFRAELLNDPSVAIEKLTGEKLPGKVNIKVIESDPAYAATFVLPPMVSGEISDDDLDNVAGGVASCGAVSCGSDIVK